jgi:DNA-3-methyladenine glycosylase I
MSKEKIRCSWCLGFDEYIQYHDTEWGVPVHDDKIHFEFLILEGAQAGLSWSTILKKRDGYRKAFANFDPLKVSRFTVERVEKMLLNPAIVRNRLKVNAAVNNAKRFLEIQKEFGSFDNYIWKFVNNKPKINKWTTLNEIAPTTPESDALSKDLIKRGFKFVGSTVIYAHMQACGLVNDHITSCFRHKEVQAK